MRVSGEGLVLGVVLDALLGDPRRWHPVAGFGRVASRVERDLYADSRWRGVVYAGVLVGGAGAAGVALERVARGRLGHALVTAAVTWAVLGGTSLGREGLLMARALERGDLEAAGRGCRICAPGIRGGSTPRGWRGPSSSRWRRTRRTRRSRRCSGARWRGSGAAGYRAVNTLDAMVGYRVEVRAVRVGRGAARRRRELGARADHRGLVVLCSGPRRGVAGPSAGRAPEHRVPTPDAARPPSRGRSGCGSVG